MILGLFFGDSVRASPGGIQKGPKEFAAKIATDLASSNEVGSSLQYLIAWDYYRGGALMMS